MSKKVLVFSGSPRKHGNSDHLADAFIDGAVQAGNETEKKKLSETLCKRFRELAVRIS